METIFVNLVNDKHHKYIQRCITYHDIKRFILHENGKYKMYILFLRPMFIKGLSWLVHDICGSMVFVVVHLCYSYWITIILSFPVKK